MRALGDIVQEGITGLVFQAGDATHLDIVVEPLLSDPGRLQALGRQAARDWVYRLRTWAQNGQGYLDPYQSPGMSMAATSQQRSV